MYQQSNHSYSSVESLGRRMSSNNPFRNISNSSNQSEERYSKSNGINMIRSPNSRNFDNWVQKNKKLISDEEEDDDNYNNYLLLDEDLSKPEFPPKPVRTNSDSSVRMSSNNPFASALNDNYVHHREPPVPPTTANGGAATTENGKRSAPTRPPKSALPPPTYEEVAGKEGVRKEYPREKTSSNGHSSSRPHRSRSDGSRPSRTHKSRSDRDRSEKDRHRSSKTKKPEATKAKNLDTIDKLDVTAFFGGGFHHDGPFDACTPHRNKNAKAAPVMAFPADGPNNSIKGLSNIDKDEQMNLAFGNYVDQNEIVGRQLSMKKKLTSKSSDDLGLNKNNGYSYNNSSNEHTSSLLVPKQNPSVINFDATLKAEPVHGYQTAGLGSSTFLDGAPAPTKDEYLNSTSNGLGRKKSLVQRLRKNSAGDNLSAKNSNDYLDSTHSTSFEESTGNSLIRRVKSLKVGRRER